jgi:hypothetical protein
MGAEFILFLFSLISFFSKGKVFVILAFFKEGASSLCHMLFQHFWTLLIGTGTCNVPSVFLGSGLVRDLLDTEKVPCFHGSGLDRDLLDTEKVPYFHGSGLDRDLLDT